MVSVKIFNMRRLFSIPKSHDPLRDDYIEFNCTNSRRHVSCDVLFDGQPCNGCEDFKVLCTKEMEMKKEDNKFLPNLKLLFLSHHPSALN